MQSDQGMGSLSGTGRSSLRKVKYPSCERLFCLNGVRLNPFCHVLTGKRSPAPGTYLSAAQAQMETQNPRANLLVSKWQQVWLLALERRRKLNDALGRLEEVRKGIYLLYA